MFLEKVRFLLRTVDGLNIATVAKDSMKYSVLSIPVYAGFLDQQLCLCFPILARFTQWKKSWTDVLGETTHFQSWNQFSFRTGHENSSWWTIFFGGTKISRLKFQIGKTSWQNKPPKPPWDLPKGMLRVMASSRKTGTNLAKASAEGSWDQVFPTGFFCGFWSPRGD